SPLVDPIFETITVTVEPAQTYWMNEPIDFTAAASNCTANPSGWSWSTDDTFTTDPVDTDNAASITFEYCPGTDCPSRTVTVSAENSGCPTAPAGERTIDVEEPRAQIRSLGVTPTGDPPFTYPVCTVLTFGATLDGQSPFGYQWALKDDMGAPVVEGVSGQTTSAMMWDTSSVEVESPPEIFADGFESGDVCGWSSGGCPLASVEGTKAAGISEEGGSARIEMLKVGALPSATFTAELQVTNLGGAHTTPVASQQVTLTALGTLAFDAVTPISSSTVDGGQFDFTANTQNATEWRWVVEDPANGTSSGAACLPLSSDPGFNCQVFDFAADNQLTYRWEPLNVPGNYQVAVEAKNCSPLVDPIFETITVDVTTIEDPVPLVVTDFDLEATTPPCSFDPLEQTWTCPQGTALEFSVAATGNPTAWQFDWEGTGTFSPQVAPNPTVSHTFSSSGTKNAQVRAVRGAELSDPFPLGQTLVISGAPE
ncbi:MAG: hypothetical protein MI919_06650, partial [Holophagales bacterium]|nr:hypothetical protein [Holophagales bacterium]